MDDFLRIEVEQIYERRNKGLPYVPRDGLVLFDVVDFAAVFLDRIAEAENARAQVATPGHVQSPVQAPEKTKEALPDQGIQIQAPGHEVAALPAVLPQPQVLEKTPIPEYRHREPRAPAAPRKHIPTREPIRAGTEEYLSTVYPEHFKGYEPSAYRKDDRPLPEAALDILKATAPGEYVATAVIARAAYHPFPAFRGLVDPAQAFSIQVTNVMLKLLKAGHVKRIKKTVGSRQVWHYALDESREGGSS